jgi:ligand-binding sensor domain-containing protein
LKQITAAHLNAIHIVSEREVWIAGSNGTVLQGNAKDGFKVLSRKTLETDFYAITDFNGEIYISGEDGIYVFRNGEPERQKISDRANLKGVSCIEAKDGVLWALSEKKLLRLVGDEWEIFEHPNNV